MNLFEHCHPWKMVTDGCLKLLLPIIVFLLRCWVRPFWRLFVESVFWLCKHFNSLLLWYCLFEINYEINQVCDRPIYYLKHKCLLNISAAEISDYFFKVTQILSHSTGTDITRFCLYFFCQKNYYCCKLFHFCIKSFKFIWKKEKYNLEGRSELRKIPFIIKHRY